LGKRPITLNDHRSDISFLWISFHNVILWKNLGVSQRCFVRPLARISVARSRQRRIGRSEHRLDRNAALQLTDTMNPGSIGFCAVRAVINDGFVPSMMMV
jgi:hypothetical protein